MTFFLLKTDGNIIGKGEVKPIQIVKVCQGMQPSLNSMNQREFRHSREQLRNGNDYLRIQRDSADQMQRAVSQSKKDPVVYGKRLSFGKRQN
jgi:hypothetical protein